MTLKNSGKFPRISFKLQAIEDPFPPSPVFFFVVSFFFFCKKYKMLIKVSFAHAKRNRPRSLYILANRAGSFVGQGVDFCCV